MQTPHFQGFSRFSYVRWRKRAVLKSRIIDSHAVLWGKGPATVTAATRCNHYRFTTSPPNGRLQSVARRQTREDWGIWGVLRFRESWRAHVQLAAAGCAILNLTVMQPLIVVVERFLEGRLRNRLRARRTRDRQCRHVEANGNTGQPVGF